MSGNKNKGLFSSQYIICQLIKEHKEKSVFIAKNIKDDQYYIAKKMPSRSSYLDREIEVMKKIKDHHIVKLYDIIEENGYTYLIEEYCQQGDIRNYLNKRFKEKSYLKQLVVSKWLLQILIGLQCLHKNNIIHRDIRPQNIFLTHEGNIKLGSFKSSKIIENQNQLAKTLINSPYYLGGQCTSQGGYNCKADIWAFGCLIYEICSLHKLTPSNKCIEQTSKMIQREGMKDIPEGYTKKLNEIYRSCFQEIALRPSSTDLLKNDYFFNRLNQLITERKSHAERIPIKKYQIHLKQLAKKRKEEPISLLKTLTEKKKYKGNKLNLLPKIERPSSSNKRCQSKQGQNKAQKTSIDKNKSRQLIRLDSREKQRPKSKQLNRIHSRERQRSRSKELIKKTVNTSLNLNNNNLYDSPVLGKKIEMVGSLASGKRSSTQKAKQQMIKSQQFMESPKPKLSLMAPPLLPKAPAKNEDPAKIQSLKKKKQTLKTESQQRIIITGQQIQQAISKVFKDLNLEDYDQILVLSEDQENQARLTQKKDEQKGLRKAYELKMSQIERKYQPQMSTIFQKTNQFDSNTFAKVKYEQNNQFL